VDEDVCRDLDLWMNTPKGHCPCMNKVNHLYIACGFRRDLLKRPVTLCRYVTRLNAMANETKGGSPGRH
jgi:hypothetical protein